MAKEKSTMILIRDYNYFFKYSKPKNLMKIYKYGKNNQDVILKKIVFKLKLPIYPFFLDKWKKNVKTCDTIIIFDNGYHPLVTKYIKKKNKNCIVKFYFWNSVSELNNYVLKDKNVDELWTFDSKDAKKYGMKYNPQFYTKQIQLKEEKELYDTLFLGRPKSRKESIIEMKDILEKKRIKD